jgi:hypothetical protein
VKTPTNGSPLIQSISTTKFTCYTAPSPNTAPRPVGTFNPHSNPHSPIMNAGPRYEYHWGDGVKIKKPIRVSAPEYVDYLMTWIQSQLDDETIFRTTLIPTFIHIQHPNSVSHSQNNSQLSSNKSTNVYSVSLPIYTIVISSKYQCLDKNRT